jgi:CheY-like chemotaxis protein
MGLGLAVVRYLVELHGGSVAVTSPGEGQGSAFTVMLPLAAAGAREGAGAPPQALAEAPEEEEAFADAPRLDGVRVLVWVRDADDREAIAGILKKSGAEVTAVGSPGEALRSMAQKPAQVLLSEVDAPGGDGYALLKEVRTLPAERGGLVPAAAVMAYARTEDRIRALREGFQLYVSKPVQPAELITVVASLADRPPPGREPT